MYTTIRRCHLGKSIVYDTVSNLSWAVDIRKHGILNVIDNVLSEPWPASITVGREVPAAEPEVDCVVRFLSLLRWMSLRKGYRSASVGNSETFHRR